MANSKSIGRWADRYYTSPDGIRLHYRDYAGPLERPPIICLPGLTRNARDFDRLAARHAGDWRVIALDLRGRGGSDPDPQPERYAPAYYLADLLKLLDQLGIADAVFVGTSLGGIVTMLLAATEPERIAGALLNDVGPEIERDGLEFIATYVGTDSRFSDWDEARREMAVRNAKRYPTFSDAQWDEFARRVCAEKGGSIGYDYDMAIGQNFRAALDSEPADLWSLLDGFDGKPVTIIRGTASDILSQANAERMVRAIPGSELVLVPDTGHSPTLDEPESIAALDRLLARVLADQA